MTESSDLSSENAITMQCGLQPDADDPIDPHKAAETTVEIPSGGSLAMAA